MFGNFIYRHHVEPRVKLYSPGEESFPTRLKYIDVSRTTRANLDVMQERRIDDYWNIDGSRNLSDLWTGFTLFTPVEEKPPDGYMWSGEELTKRQVTSRPDHLWPELWIKLGRNAKMMERQKWSTEKTKLDSARRLRGIYFIDPEDKEFKETINNAHKKLETPMALAMPCKTGKKSKHGETRGKTNEFKSKLACILEASESTRLRMDKEWEKLEKISAWNLTKVRSKSEVIDEARTKGAKVHFASLMDICHLKNAELEAKHQKCKGRVVLRGGIVKDDSGSYAIFIEQGSSSSSQMIAA